jgi:hypothetical protein
MKKHGKSELQVISETQTEVRQTLVDTWRQYHNVNLGVQPEHRQEGISQHRYRVDLDDMKNRQ